MALKILLADDSLTAQNMGKKILTEAGYEVIAVSNGAQAMKRIASDNPDLVVLDVYMPGYSGLELCEHMRSTRETATTPVVLSVGKMEAFQPEESNRVRADGLIVKPFEATELLAVVKKLAENVSPATRAKRRPDPKPAPEPITEPAPCAPPPAAEPDFEIQRHFVNVPEEVASAPAIGMELIPEEAHEAEPSATIEVPQPPATVEFELEQAPERVDVSPGPHMSSVDGLSGVFELETSAPAVEAAAGAEPVKEFETSSALAAAEPQPLDPPPTESAPVTVEHDPMVLPPESYEAGPEPLGAPVFERFSEPAASEPPPSNTFDQSFDQAQPDTSADSGPAQVPEVLPELTSWEPPAAPLPAEIPHMSDEPVLKGSEAEDESVLNNSEPELASSQPVWVAEEVPVEPHEFAIPLHQQMQTQTAIEEPTADAAPAESMTREALLDAASYPPPTPLALPAPVAELELPADSPQSFPPVVTEAPVDPQRIASIVERVLERLKPELVAAVTRELEKSWQ